MRINYLSQMPDELPKPPPKPDPELRAEGPSIFARLRSVLALLLSVAVISAIPYLLAKDFARVQGRRSPAAIDVSEVARSSQSALASSEVWVHHAMKTAEYATAWGRLMWSSFSDFEDSLELLRAAPDRKDPAQVAQRRRRGADQIVILLDRHGLLPMLNQEVSGTQSPLAHAQLAEKIGEMLNIDPRHVSQAFRDAQQDQILALREALDRHLSNEPGPSDLSQFAPKPTATR